MNRDQTIKQTIDINKIILENTYAFVQTEKFLSEKAPWLEPWFEAKKRFNNRYGKLYERFYEDGEVSSAHIIKLYKTAHKEA